MMWTTMNSDCLGKEQTVTLVFGPLDGQTRRVPVYMQTIHVVDRVGDKEQWYTYTRINEKVFAYDEA